MDAAQEDPVIARGEESFPAGWTWESLAALPSSTGTELAHLIQRNDHDALSTKDRMLQVDRLVEIASKNPDLFQEQDYNGWLPFHAAVENEIPLECIKILVEAYPESVLVRYNSVEGLQTVIRRARTTETRDYLLDQAIKYLRSSLSRDWYAGTLLVQSFFVFHHDMDIVVERVVQEFPDFLRVKGSFSAYDDGIQRLPLHYAVEVGAPLEVLKKLITGYPKALDIKTKEGETPLHIACRTRQAEPNVLRLLMTVKAVRAWDKKGNLPLHCYMYLEPTRTRYMGTLDLQVVRLMVELYPNGVRKKGGEGLLPLLMACRFGSENNLPVIRFLTEVYPYGLREEDNLGHTPIFIACGYAGEDNLPVIQFLIEACPESVRDLDPSGLTVLHWHCQIRLPDLSVVRLLVTIYPDMLRIKDKNNQRTPLHIACRSSPTLDVIRFMAQACPEVLETGGSDTPIHTICSYIGRLPDTRARAFAILEVLCLSKKAVEAKDSLGRTPLHLLCRLGESPQFLQVMIEKSPKVVGEKDSDGRTPLHAVIDGWADRADSGKFFYDEECYEETFQFILEAYPLGVHSVDNSGMTPLMLACERNVSVSLIYQLVRVDPIANNRGFEWSQIPRENREESSSLWEWLHLTVNSLLFES